MFEEPQRGQPQGEYGGGLPLPLHLIILLTVIYFGEKTLDRGPGADSDALLAGAIAKLRALASESESRPAGPLQVLPPPVGSFTSTKGRLAKRGWRWKVVPSAAGLAPGTRRSGANVRGSITSLRFKLPLQSTDRSSQLQNLPEANQFCDLENVQWLWT